MCRVIVFLFLLPILIHACTECMVAYIQAHMWARAHTCAHTWRGRSLMSELLPIALPPYSLRQGLSIKTINMTMRTSTAAPNLWVETTLGVIYQISCISENYITIHNGGKITATK